MAYPQPVMVQPGAHGNFTWMAPPIRIAGCPPGLEYLAHLDQVIVKQETSFVELLTNWEVKNKFRIFNNVAQQIYFASEESSMLQRQCCGPHRSFVYHFTDNMNQEVFRVRREFQCVGLAACATCCDCIPYYASCEDMYGETMGYVSNLCFCFTPTFAIYDREKQIIFTLQSRCCPCQSICCPWDINFKVTDQLTNNEVGVIKKTWPGLLKDWYTDSDNYAALFPLSMEVWKKALIIGAVLIIDMMLYEDPGSQKS